MITIYEIAKYCGVSPSTVSKAMNGYTTIPASTRKKILQAIKDLNYVPNAGAFSLSKGKTFNVGILAYFGADISPFKHSLFSDILDTFQIEMNKYNYDLLFISKNVRGKNQTFLKNCIARRVDGVCLFGDTTSKELLEVIESDLPTVAFDYIGEKSSSVSSNNKELTKKLVNYLISLNHKKIAFIKGDNESKTNLVRLNAYLETLKENNIEIDESLIVESRYYETENVEKTLKILLNNKNRPTAIMMPDDYTAINAIKVLNKMGFNCPKDISVTGFDGIDVGQVITPSLTTVKQDVKKIGEALAKELIRIIKEKDNINFNKIVVEGKLIIGESTGFNNK